MSFLNNNVVMRILSALILMPYVAGMIWYGGWPYALSVVAFTGLIFAEWVRMVYRDQDQRAILTIVGFFYFLPFMGGLITMRVVEPQGMYLTLMVMVAVWVSDIFAYLIGKWLQGPKIAPWISPHKTWSGFIGAIVSPVIFVIAFVSLTPLEYSLMAQFIFGVVIGISCQVGDFFISMIKRHVGVKDTGGIVPGHGGMLDRMDSLVLAVPIFYLMVKML